MYILSKNKKEIIKVTKVYISKNYGGKKDEKFSIVGISLEQSISGTILGKYPTEEAALIELEHIFIAMQNDEKVYAIR